MDYGTYIFFLPQLDKSGELAAAVFFISLEQMDGKAHDFRAADYPEHRTHHELQSPMSRMSLRSEIFHSPYRDASGVTF